MQSAGASSIAEGGWELYRANGMGPGAFKHRGARIFVISEGFLVHTIGSQNRKARGLCAPIPPIALDFSVATRLAAAVRLNLRRDLAVEQGRWLVRWRHAPLQEWPDRHVRTYLLFDRMIGRQCPRSGEPDVPLPRQVQQPKCCGRYGRVSSCIARSWEGSLPSPTRWKMRAAPPPRAEIWIRCMSRLGLAILAEIRIMRHRPVIDEPPQHGRVDLPALNVAIVGRTCIFALALRATRRLSTRARSFTHQVPNS